MEAGLVVRATLMPQSQHPDQKPPEFKLTPRQQCLDVRYDAGGNMTTRNGQTVSWKSYALASVINGGGGSSSEFFYTPGRTRWKQQASYAGTSEQTIYIGGLIEKVVRGGQTSWRHAIRGAQGTVAIYTRESGGSNAMHYLLDDHLGSVEAVTDGAGAVEVRLSYAPFGQRRNASGWAGNPSAGDWGAITATTRHGYTAHEHLDNLSLIHMNGRVYDPYIGRFTSADPYLDGAGRTAGWNRYSYVRNSPLSYTDPSGFQSTQCRGSTTPCVPTSPAGWQPLGTSNIEIVDVFGKRLRNAVESLKALTLQQWSIGAMDLKLPGEVADSELEEVTVEAERPQSQQPMPQCVRRAGDGKFGFDDFVNFSAGLGDALLLGFGDELRDMMGIGSVDMNTNAYSAGAWASFAAGMSRAGYAIAAKGYSMFASSGAAASAGRESLKNIGRVGQAKDWRKFDPTGKTDAELRIGAGKTNKWVNAYGAGVAAAGGFGANGCN